jgi:UTP--glucose-1-phosphate uridylyltransferase
MTITKAIIPVAGWGTRRLPITKTIEKCMLPVGNRPIVDYVVQDCLSAGITDIIFVVSEQSQQLRDYYRSNIDLNDYLKRTGKADMLEMIRPIDAHIHFVVQPSYGKYGSAIPVALAAEYIGVDESVVVLMGDDFIYNVDGSSETARLIEATPSGQSGMLGVEVPLSDVSRYGVIETNAAHEFVSIVEKPAPADAPSNLINVSKYVLNPTMLKQICDYAATDRVAGEYYITDPINTAVTAGETMKVVPATGIYLDGGNVESWLAANQIVIAAERAKIDRIV